jgi:hypothetical protein
MHSSEEKHKGESFKHGKNQIHATHIKHRCVSYCMQPSIIKVIFTRLS